MFRKIHEVRTAVPRIHCLVGSGRQRYKKKRKERHMPDGSGGQRYQTDENHRSAVRIGRAEMPSQS